MAHKPKVSDRPEGAGSMDHEMSDDLSGTKRPAPEEQATERSAIDELLDDCESSVSNISDAETV